MNIAMEQKCVMIIAGEASGDRHGANLVREMRARDRSLFFCGVGGDALKAAGAKIFFDISALSVMGITEVIARLPVIMQAMGMAKNLLKNLRPDLLILVDFADFNLRVAATAKKYHIPVLYFIPPKVWAWRTGRVNIIKERVDQLAVILPFEADFFKKHGITATYIGNPLMDDLGQLPDPPETGGAPVIGLLPGSRRKEVLRHLPVLLEAGLMIHKKMTDAKFMVSLAPTVDRRMVEDMMDAYADTGLFELVEGSVDQIFDQAQFLVAASGTVTLEAALAGIPMVIIYKASAISYWIASMFAKVDYAGLANLIAGEEIIPELLQSDANSGHIAETVCRLMADSGRLEQMKKNLLEVREKLDGPGASGRAADLAIDMMAGTAPEIR